MAVFVKINVLTYYISNRFYPVQFFASIHKLLFETIDKNILEKLAINKTKTTCKSEVLLKVVRAKLTGTWEGGGVGGKKHANKLFLHKGPIPTTTPMGNRVNNTRTNVTIIDEIFSKWFKEHPFKVWS